MERLSDMERLIEPKTGRLLDPQVVGDLAMQLDRIELSHGARHEVEPVAEGEELFVYVVSGVGVAEIDGDPHALGLETVVWLEPGDACTLVGGEAGLTALVSRARGDDAAA